MFDKIRKKRLLEKYEEMDLFDLLKVKPKDLLSESIRFDVIKQKVQGNKAKARIFRVAERWSELSPEEIRDFYYAIFYINPPVLNTCNLVSLFDLTNYPNWILGSGEKLDTPLLIRAIVAERQKFPLGHFIEGTPAINALRFREVSDFAGKKIGASLLKSLLLTGEFPSLPKWMQDDIVHRVVSCSSWSFEDLKRFVSLTRSPIILRKWINKCGSLDEFCQAYLACPSNLKNLAKQYAAPQLKSLL
jgi:hypothetical protein